MTAVFVQGSPVWLLKRTMQWPLSNRQSTQFAETALPEACGINLKLSSRFAKLSPTEQLRNLTQDTFSSSTCPDMPRCSFSHPIKKATHRRACDGLTFFLLRQVQQKSLWNDSPHHPIRRACDGLTFFLLRQVQQKGLWNDSPHHPISQTFPPRLFCEVHILFVFRPSVGLVLKDEKWKSTWSNYHEYLRAEMHHSFKG